MTAQYSVFGVPDIPMIKHGDRLSEVIGRALEAGGLSLQSGDVICLAQKIVSKAEGRMLALSSVKPGPEARELAQATNKDPRMVQLILDESTEVLRHKPNVLIVRHKLGIVGAHAGIDQSNIDHQDEEQALLLPEDPDASAAVLRDELQKNTGVDLGVVITDSHNRPWRMGTIGCAIGCAGIRVLDDQVGGQDIYGRTLHATLINRADAIASAATLVMGETTEKLPVVVIRGLNAEQTLSAEDRASVINRPLEEDLFR
ncbi:MAG: coenzyme F420-0:L-glutamate ligase [Gammaproteobacteria bacterium]|mgnify:FL=1|nr:coenzyme F420-0:L-glutamate ligase [Gammaproteobacteria bacterium]|tara:strand:+ start:9327 stop:10100 length:774 start_codon:yes stop_codon:yes gene_type:complete